MRTIAATAAALAVAFASPAAASTGPFTGTVTQGQTKYHYYDNNPKGYACPDVMMTYTVSMTYTPATATLTLSAGGQSAAGSNGYAAVSFWASACTAFTISVHGTSVSGSASYHVTVSSSHGGGVEA